MRNRLDGLALVNAVKALKAKGVDTFVIGFGSAFNNPAAKATVDAAAVAGGQAQTGAATKFFLAEDSASLQAILDHVKALLQPCIFVLSHPPTSSFGLIVKVSDQSAETTLVQGSDWDFADSSLTSVVLRQTWCTKLQSTEAGRYVVEFQLVDCPQ